MFLDYINSFIRCTMDSVRLKSHVWNKQTFFQVCTHQIVTILIHFGISSGQKTFCIMFLSHCLILSCHLTEYFFPWIMFIQNVAQIFPKLMSEWFFHYHYWSRTDNYLWIPIFIFSHNNLQDSSSNFLTHIPVLSFTTKSIPPYIHQGHSSKSHYSHSYFTPSF